jgi:hypothetical protein
MFFTQGSVVLFDLDFFCWILLSAGPGGVILRKPDTGLLRGCKGRSIEENFSFAGFVASIHHHSCKQWLFHYHFTYTGRLGWRHLY